MKIWEIDINKTYWVDEDYNIYNSQEDFYEKHFEDYHGTKDNYEEWCSYIEAEYKLQEKEGSEIIKTIYEDMMETIEMYRNKQW